MNLYGVARSNDPVLDDTGKEPGQLIAIRLNPSGYLILGIARYPRFLQPQRDQADRHLCSDDQPTQVDSVERQILTDSPWRERPFCVC